MVTIGYDMTTAQPMTEQEQAAHTAAADTFKAAVKVRDALPKEEAGRFRGMSALTAEKISDDDNRAYAGRTERFSAAQDAVTAAYDAMQAADKSYFRLNIGGMGRYMDAMSALGMLQTARSPLSFPDAPDNVADDFWDNVYEAKEDLAAGKTDLDYPADVLDHARETYALLSWTPEPVTGLCASKFSTNDGWHVLPVEIEAALTAYRKHTGEIVKAACANAGIVNLDYWLRWIGYLIYAQQHGGFLVH